MIGGLVDCNGNTENFKVQGAEIINPGYGYTTPPAVAFVGGGGAGAAATATIGDGIVGIVTITSGGSGYESAPVVTFSPAPGAGVTATAAAYINSAGVVTSIYIRNAGLGYTVTPTITISSPYSSGTGSYQFGEVVTGSVSGTTAIVKSWNASTNILQVSNIRGSFTKGDVITGSKSGANYKLRIIDTYNLQDRFAENEIIEEEADSIIDFNESNPFGNP
jgi:hypothetical protein